MLDFGLALFETNAHHAAMDSVPKLTTDAAGNPKPRGRTRFQPGQSGNPKGKPRGAKNRVLLALDKIGVDNAAPVLSAAVAAAIGGDTRAMEIILGRVWPARRGRPVLLPDLPPIKSAADLPAAVGAIVQAVATGCLTPDEGHALGGLVEYQRRSLELVEIEARLAVLEAQSQVERTD